MHGGLLGVLIIDVVLIIRGERVLVFVLVVSGGWVLQCSPSSLPVGLSPGVLPALFPFILWGCCPGALCNQ